MRYRPFGLAGQTISAVTLALGDRPDGEAARVRLVYAALEAGVNSFELRDPSAAGALGAALEALERRMVVISVRISGGDRLDRVAVVDAIERPLLAGRFGRLDAVMVDHPARLTRDGWDALITARQAGRVRMIGAAGDGVDEALVGPELDLMGCVYHLGSVWADRNKLLTAVRAGRSIVGHGYHPALGGGPVEGGRKRGLFGLTRRPAPIEKLDGYEFLRRTPGWAADEICLGYALTEPSLATIVIEPTTPDDVDRLAAVTERELPTGLAAQIEMARFAQAG